MINRKSLAVKIASGYLVAILMFTIVVLFNLYRSSELQVIATDIVEQQVPGVNSSLDIVINVEHSLSAIQGWVALGEPKFKEKRQLAWGNIDSAFQNLNSIARLNNEQYLLSDLEQLQYDLNQLRTYQQDVEQLAHTIDSKPGLKMLSEQVAPLTKKLVNLTTQLLNIEARKQSNNAQIQRLFANLRFQFAQCISSIRIYLITDQEKYLAEFDNNWEKNEQTILQLKNLMPNLNNQQKILLQELMLVRDEFIQYPDQLFDYRQNQEWDLAKLRTNSWIGPLAEKIKTQINSIISAQNRTMQDGFNSMLSGFDLSMKLGIGLLLVGILLATVFVVVLIQLIVKPVNQVIAAANQISQGDFSVEVDISGTLETERLGLALKDMTMYLKRIANHATLLAKGNFNIDFRPQSNQDHLSQALSSMTKHLKQSQQDSVQQNWLKTGIATIADRLKGVEDVEQVCQQGLHVIAHYLGAKTGALYLCDEKQCNLAAGYAFTLDGQMKKQYQMGQGLVGQTAKDASPLTYNIKPSEQPQLIIDIGLTNVSATHIIVIPVINTQSNKNAVNAVIVLALEHSCNQQEFELLSKMSESLSININSAQSRAKLECLLTESQQQAKALQNQQEELRLFNEELEQQAQALKVSEEELQAQGDELKQNNQLLEQQKSDLEHKNAEIKAAHKALEQKAFELDQTSKFKSEFMANMSHELRTPLNCLLILSQSLANNSNNNLEEEQVNDLEIIYQAGQTLLSLINDILDLSKIEAGKLKPEFSSVNTRNLIQYLEKLFHPIAQENGLAFKLEMLADCPETFVTDEHRLHQILRNLLSNAFKFTKRGEVKLTISSEPTLSDLSQSSIRIQVKDSGIGITEQAQKVIFEAFQQADGSTSRAYGGTGLGLTISRELVSLLGGQIFLESTLGEGSCFTLVLPYAQPLASEESNIHQSVVKRLPEPNNRKLTKASDKTILVVINDEEFALSVINNARQLGFSCLHALTGQEALELTTNNKLSAVILDLDLPDISGLEVFDYLKQALDSRYVPVHIIPRTQEHVTLMRQKATGVLYKPVHIEKLQELMSRFSSLVQKNIRTILYITTTSREEDKLIATFEHLSLTFTSLIYTDGMYDWQEVNRLQAEQNFDCIIIDIYQQQLNDNNELTCLQQLDEKRILPPIIICCDAGLDIKSEAQLAAYSKHINVKSHKQVKHINDEVVCFLHSVNKQSPANRLSDLVQQGDIDLAKRKILLVDDDLRNTYALSKVLKDYGMEINIADNGVLALEKMGQGKQFDLILMDIMMPEMDGFEAMRRIRSDFSADIPIIALTAKAMSEDKEKCIEAGANDYLAKPVDMNQLLSMIKVWVCK